MFNNKRIVATIEARMTSSRLPGKVILPLAGKPALERMIERVKRSRYVDEVVVATTINAADDCLEDLAKRLGVGCYRGSELDVLDRVLKAAQKFSADIIVELTGDCPLMDWRLVDRGIEDFFATGVDYSANDLKTTYPIGFDVQVFPTAVLAEVSNLTNDPIDRVHVSYYIYSHPDKFKVHNWEAEADSLGPEFRVTLDEQADYELIKIIFDNLLKIREDFTASDVVNFLRKNLELSKINQHVRQKDIQEG